ncbi:MAG: magnesium transporter [Pleurocapsa sp.]
MTQPQDSAISHYASSHQEIRELVRSQLQVLLEQENFQGVKALLIPVQPPDIADAIEELPEPMQLIAFRLLSKEEAIKVYENLEPNSQRSLLKQFKHQDVLDIVDRMSPDDRVRLLAELPAKVVHRLLQQLSSQEREATSLLLGYKPETAGRIMTPEYVALRENLTVAQTLERLRSLASTTETIYYLYIIDASRHLTGIASLRDLLTAQPEQNIDEIMTRNVVYVETDTDREEVARIIQHYDFVALPVVDRERRLVGIVTIDDVVDILEQEATEDIYTLGGVESTGDNYFQTNLLTVARKRVVWLLVLLIANTATSAVIQNQEDILEQFVILAAFIPLLIDAGGNIGAQSSTVVIRGLNTDEVNIDNAIQIIGKETITGILLGTILAIAVTAWAYILQGNLGVAVSVGISLLAIAILASVSGAALPFLFRRLNLDPALMSAPFITSIVDVIGVFIYLVVAQAILL